ncbi:MAG: hypothetical protein K6G36_01975 [Candidatus Saccharibacteria bacterium]|nr:hypothetical protein [Candidatus Saccharibacteria bacterium]
MKTFNEKALKKDLLINAKALGIPSGAARTFADKIVKNVSKTLKNKKIITESDLNRAVLKELNVYNADLAYVYENRDKII